MRIEPKKWATSVSWIATHLGWSHDVVTRCINAGEIRHETLADGSLLVSLESAKECLESRAAKENARMQAVENQIAPLLKKGMSYRQVAESLGTHKTTVAKYAQRIREKQEKRTKAKKAKAKKPTRSKAKRTASARS